MKFLAKKIVYGCDSRGDANSPYLTRWTILSCKLGAIYLHKFHRSDSPEHHDHPWAFASLILWRGYFEEVPCHKCNPSGRIFSTLKGFHTHIWPCCGGTAKESHRVWPGNILFRKATHRHRVVLIKDKPAWTLVIRGPYVREWGFITKRGWQLWTEYFKENGCQK